VRVSSTHGNHRPSRLRSESISRKSAKASAARSGRSSNSRSRSSTRSKGNAGVSHARLVPIALSELLAQTPRRRSIVSVELLIVIIVVIIVIEIVVIIVQIVVVVEVFVFFAQPHEPSLCKRQARLPMAQGLVNLLER
jgi:hypothetical protein